MKRFLSPKLCRFAGVLAACASVSLTATNLRAQSNAVPAPAAPFEPEQKPLPAASCPIRIDEAFLTADPAAIPAESAAGKRTLHATLVDVSGKQIVSYVVHAQIATRPTGPSTDAPASANVTRHWRGALEPDTPTRQQWTFAADRFTTGLRRVWFDKVAFADGTLWNKAANDGCSFAATGRVMQTKDLPQKH